MNWCKRHKDRNWDNVMFSDEWTFYLKLQEEWDGWWKMNSMCHQGSSILIKLFVWENFQQKKKWICISLTGILIQIYISILEFSLPEMNKIMINSVTL